MYHYALNDQAISQHYGFSGFAMNGFDYPWLTHQLATAVPLP
jgi:hypothetical protein